jgi:sugar diacid utilization regulator
VAVGELDITLEFGGPPARRWRSDHRTLAGYGDDLERELTAQRLMNGLLAALAERLADLDIDGILVEVSRVLGADAALVSPRGAVLAGARSAVPSLDRLRAAARSLPSRGDPEALPDVILPVRDSGGAVLAYLCLECAPVLFDSHTWPALGAFLAAVAAVQVELRNGAVRSESSFLLSLLFAGDEFPEGELGGWARRLGIDLSTPHRIAFLTRPPAERSGRSLEREQRLSDLLGGIGSRAVLATTRDGLVCCFDDPAPRPSSHWVRVWEKVLADATDVGLRGATVGGAFAGVDGVRRSYQQARSLAERQREKGRVLAVPGVAVYEEGGLAEIVLGHPDCENLQAYVRRVLGPLLDDARFGGELADTLEAYLATGGSPAGAAQLLHLHPSSVKYRMRVIRDLVGSEQLDDYDHRFELELALRMLRTLQGAPGRVRS